MGCAIDQALHQVGTRCIPNTLRGSRPDDGLGAGNRCQAGNYQRVRSLRTPRGFSAYGSRHQGGRSTPTNNHSGTQKATHTRQEPSHRRSVDRPGRRPRRGPAHSTATQALIAKQRARDIRALGHRIGQLTPQITALVKATSATLTQIHGIGDLTAAAAPGRVVRVLARSTATQALIANSPETKPPRKPSATSNATSPTASTNTSKPPSI